MDRLIDLETQFKTRSRRIDESIYELKSELQDTIYLLYIAALLSVICYFLF